MMRVFPGSNLRTIGQRGRVVPEVVAGLAVGIATGVVVSTMAKNGAHWDVPRDHFLTVASAGLAAISAGFGMRFLQVKSEPQCNYDFGTPMVELGCLAGSLLTAAAACFSGYAVQL